MNETLKEIAIKAQVEHCVSHVRLEKFAELIIKECVVISKKMMTGKGAAREINKHFGVGND